MTRYAFLDQAFGVVKNDGTIGTQRKAVPSGILAEGGGLIARC